jgi:hypothetical protein
MVRFESFLKNPVVHARKMVRLPRGKSVERTERIPGISDRGPCQPRPELPGRFPLRILAWPGWRGRRQGVGRDADPPDTRANPEPSTPEAEGDSGEIPLDELREIIGGRTLYSNLPPIRPEDWHP